MNKERRLGRGLEALLGRPLNSVNEEAVSAAGQGRGASASVYAIESNPYQPRADFDQASVDELADSIRRHGVLQPLVVRRVGERYQLIAGERRLRAAIKSGLAEVPIVVRDADDRQVAELAIVENLQRKDLNPLEKAASFERYLEQFSCTQDELAARLGIDRSTIANLIRLLELPDAVQAALRRGTISQGHARALLPLGDEREQLALCRRIESESLSVRTVEETVQQHIRSDDGLTDVGGKPSKATALRPASAQLAAIEQQLRGALGLKVELRQSSRGRGRLVIHFRSHEEFERLRGQLTAPVARREAG